VFQGNCIWSRSTDHIQLAIDLPL